ncbi:MAG: ABC transporter ATP-binding protein [Chloroflexi bacterium]|nr:ABC transporter ATP-binding protein [Chloroflexota bacterium]
MTKPQKTRQIDTNGSLLSVRGVFKIYKENDIETVALRDASFDVAPGDFVAIQGRSGSGKTTLLNMIGGLDTPSAGQVILAGQDMARMDEDERAAYRKQHIGIVFQTGNLIPFLSALENVEQPMTWNGMGSSKARQRATQLLSDLGLGDRLHHKGSQLSGGEAQRVGIAIALANEPELLIADELTGELDTSTTEQVMESLHNLHIEHQLTLLVVTHNKNVAARAQRVLQLQDGAILEETRHA